MTENDPVYGWNGKDKYGWVVSNVFKFQEYQPAPKNKGVVFTLNCNVLMPSGVV